MQLSVTIGLQQHSHSYSANVIDIGLLLLHVHGHRAVRVYAIKPNSDIRALHTELRYYHHHHHHHKFIRRRVKQHNQDTVKHRTNVKGRKYEIIKQDFKMEVRA